MERVRCPICERNDLRPAKPGEGGLVLHANEHYEHVISGGRHLLVRTERNFAEERGISIEEFIRRGATLCN